VREITPHLASTLEIQIEQQLFRDRVKINAKGILLYKLEFN
jgi:hypothetical protein